MDVDEFEKFFFFQDKHILKIEIINDILNHIVTHVATSSNTQQ